MNGKDRKRDLIRAIKSDPMVEAFNSLLVGIYTNAVPMYILSGVTVGESVLKKQWPIFNVPIGVVVEQIYDKKTQKLIDEIHKSNDDYLSVNYGEKEKDNVANQFPSGI